VFSQTVPKSGNCEVGPNTFGETAKESIMFVHPVIAIRAAYRFVDLLF
jgi:hypothetical protein